MTQKSYKTIMNNTTKVTELCPNTLQTKSPMNSIITNHILLADDGAISTLQSPGIMHLNYVTFFKVALNLMPDAI